MRRIFTSAVRRAVLLALAASLAASGPASASDLDAPRLMRRHQDAFSGDVSLRDNAFDRHRRGSVTRSTLDYARPDRDGIYDLSSRDRRDRWRERRLYERADRTDRRDWPRAYREDRRLGGERDRLSRSGWSNRGIVEARRLRERDDDGYLGTYDDRNEFPSIIPGRGAYAGGLSAFVDPGNGTYFSVDRNGVEEDTIVYRTPPRHSLIIDVKRRGSRSCSFEAGVCVIRGQ